MFYRAIIVFLVLWGSQSFLHASQETRVRLRSGAMVVGELLKESAENLVIDLGFTALNVPRSSVAAIDKLKPRHPDSKSAFGTSL